MPKPSIKLLTRLFGAMTASLIAASWPFWVADGFILGKPFTVSLTDALEYSLGAAGVSLLSFLFCAFALRFLSSADQPSSTGTRMNRWSLMLPALAPAVLIATHSASPLIAAARIGCYVLWLALSCFLSIVILSRIAPELISDRWKGLLRTSGRTQ
jgi:hypothetical protein